MLQNISLKVRFLGYWVVFSYIVGAKLWEIIAKLRNDTKLLQGILNSRLKSKIKKYCILSTLIVVKNVTINCIKKLKNLYIYKMKTSQPPLRKLNKQKFFGKYVYCCKCKML